VARGVLCIGRRRLRAGVSPQSTAPGLALNGPGACGLNRRRCSKALHFGHEKVHYPFGPILLIQRQAGLGVEMRVEPQSAGLDGYSGESVGWSSSDFFGHHIDAEKQRLRDFDLCVNPVFDPRSCPELKRVLIRGRR
jgi:hypothetical protein